MPEEVKHCGTCKHYGFACDKCHGHDMWEPEEEKEATMPQFEQTGTVVQLNIGEGSAIELANAICKYERELIADIETTLIFLDELSEHIDSYVRAERKWLEYQKRKEE